MVAPVAIIEEQHSIVRDTRQFSNPWEVTLGLIAAKYHKTNQEKTVRHFDGEVITCRESFTYFSSGRSHNCITALERCFTCLEAVGVQFG